MSDRVVNFPISPEETISPEEKLRRIMVEAERLSKRSELEWQFWLKTTDIAEKLGTTRDYLKTAILGLIREREKKAAEERRIEQRAEKKAEQATKQKAKEKAKAVADAAKLPRDQRDAEIADLAERFDEEVEALTEEVTSVVAAESSLPSDGPLRRGLTRSRRRRCCRN